MVDFMGSVREKGNGNNIEPDFLLELRPGKVRAGSTLQVFLLLPGNGFFRISVPVADPGFHFREDQDAFPGGDQINLGMPETPVPLQDPVAFFLQIPAGDFLPPPTQFMMGRHNLTIFVLII